MTINQEIQVKQETQMIRSSTKPISPCSVAVIKDEVDNVKCELNEQTSPFVKLPIVKLEDVQDAKKKLSEVNDSILHYKECDKRYFNKYSYRHHMQRHHNMVFRKVNPLIQPDKYDPNNYCCSREKIYAFRKSYVRHLKNVQKIMIVEPKKNNPSIQPDVDDPKLYCRSCLKTFSRREHYRKHILRVHEIELVSFVKYDPNMKAVDINDPMNTSCNDCKLIFGTRSAYLSHAGKHNGCGDKQLRTYNSSKADSSIILDMYDPNKYCKSCKYTYASRENYKGHLKDVHGIHVPKKAKLNPGIVPEAVLDSDVISSPNSL